MSTKKKILNCVNKIAFRTVKDSEDLKKEGILDSVSVIELAVKLEQLFSIHIPSEDIHSNHFQSIDSITIYMKDRIKK
jgi:acyl carrier protein